MVDPMTQYIGYALYFVFAIGAMLISAYLVTALVINFISAIFGAIGYIAGRIMR